AAWYKNPKDEKLTRDLTTDLLADARRKEVSETHRVQMLAVAARAQGRSGDLAGYQAALKTYLELFDLLQRRTEGKPPAATRYPPVLIPGLASGEEGFKKLGAKLGKELAAVYAAKGKLINANLTADWPDLKQRPAQEAYNAYDRASQLDPNDAHYPV